MFLALSLSTLMVISDVGGAVLLGTNVPANSGNTSHQQINCIMQQTQQPYKLLPMPWRRAKQEVKMGRIDGYFTAIPNDEMNDYAKLSAPLFLENWYWFWHPRHSGPDSGLVTEVILMDNQGANVAISEITTDYWQGDETPFLSVFGQQSDYFIDVVEYDQSTRRFQVKLSVPVADAQGSHSGALSIGIDVERALSAND